MTEKQRSDAGLPYFPGDEELRALRARCKQLCYAVRHKQKMCFIKPSSLYGL